MDVIIEKYDKNTYRLKKNKFITTFVAEKRESRQFRSFLKIQSTGMICMQWALLRTEIVDKIILQKIIY